MTYTDNSFCKQKTFQPEDEVHGVKGECRAYSSLFEHW